MFHSVTSPTAGASCELYLAIQTFCWKVRCYRARVKREQARTAECICDLPTYGQYKGFFKLGIKSTCMHCTSSIEAGVLYGGYDAERDRFYWKEFTFHHCLGECGLPGPFPGRTSRQWQASIDEAIFKTPGGIGHEAYQQPLKHCGATADFVTTRISARS